MDQFMESKVGKAVFFIVGFGLPVIFLAAQVLFGFGNLPLMILALSWFGFATLFYMGLTEE